MRPRRVTLLGCAVMAMIVILAAFVYFGEGHCFFKNAFGIPCPGCGLTRACVALLRFDFKESLSLHPMVWSLPVVAGYVLTQGRLFKRLWLNNLIISLIAVGFIVVYAVRLSAGTIP